MKDTTPKVEEPPRVGCGLAGVHGDGSPQESRFLLAFDVVPAGREKWPRRMANLAGLVEALSQHGNQGMYVAS